MTTLGWATMALICGLVWGGFTWFLAKAVQAERRKSSPSSEKPS